MREYERYQFTWHVRHRYVERFLKPKQSFTEEEIKRYVQANLRQVDSEICRRLHKSVEEEHLDNEEAILAYLNERYGEKNYRFLVDRYILFIIAVEDGKQIVLTCFNATNSFVGRSVRKKLREHRLERRKSIGRRRSP